MSSDLSKEGDEGKGRLWTVIFDEDQRLVELAVQGSVSWKERCCRREVILAVLVMTRPQVWP